LINLNLPQKDFIDVTEPFRGYVGGYRAGKTFVGCVRLWMLACQYPDIKLGYFAPTYPHIRDIFYTTIEEVAEDFSAHAGGHCSVEILKAENLVKLLVDGVVRATVKCRSMEHPYRIVGFDISHALVDEIDIMKIDKADQAWKKIVARMSSVREDYKVNTVDFTTTPEGFNWMHRFFVKELNEKPEMKPYYKLVKASTLQNRKNLPEDYIDKLYATYPENLVEAYVNGEFVNLTSGTVYNEFDREKHDTDATWNGSEPLHIGMDFNVCNMSAIISVIRNGNVYDVDEITGSYDTPSIINTIKERYQRCQINIYPDASGKNRNAQSASESSIQLLRQAGLNVFAPNKNPFVKDRVLAMNTSFSKGFHYVNISKCPNHASNLEQQVYNDAGEPDKSAGNDHTNDANGYLISYKYPVVKPQVKKTRLI